MSQVTYEQVLTEVVAVEMAGKLMDDKPLPEIIRAVFARAYELGYGDGFISRQDEFDEMLASSQALQVQAQAVEARIDSLKEMVDRLREAL